MNGKGIVVHYDSARPNASLFIQRKIERSQTKYPFVFAIWPRSWAIIYLDLYICFDFRGAPSMMII